MLRTGLGPRDIAMSEVAGVSALMEQSRYMVMKQTIAQTIPRDQGPVETLQLEAESFMRPVCACGLRALRNLGRTLDSHSSQRSPAQFPPILCSTLHRPATRETGHRTVFLPPPLLIFVPAASSAFLHRSLYNGFQKALPGKTLPHPPCPN